MTPSRTLVLHPHLKHGSHAARTPAAQLDEAEGLAHAIDLAIVSKLALPLSEIRPSTLLGKGKVEELGALITELEISLVVINGNVSPVQQRNLKKAWNCKVIDRTALILEIFGARARTAEGKLQVELAALNYQKTRLVRSWTHLERQRGGFGFLGGPGESQIEIDRRLIRDRIAKIRRELTQVTRTRELHRKKRRSAPYPIIALVGYTNAGKSTLFNRLTGASVVAMDKLFATLDPTMRAIRLPSGATVILSDTVGFVSDLPTELIAAFRATLEEVLEADILLHVRDVAHTDALAQKKDVENVLKKLFQSEQLPENVIEVLNKIDQLPHFEFPPGSLPISALTGEGVSELLATLDARIRAAFFIELNYNLPAGDGKAISWLHRNGKVLSEESDDDTLHVSVLLSPDNAGRFEKLFERGTYTVKRFTALALMLLACLPCTAFAQERLTAITVMTDSYLSLPLARLARDYTRDRGIAVSIAINSGDAVSRQIADGAAGDVLITARENWLAELRQQGLVDVYSETVLLRDRLALVAPDYFTGKVEISSAFPTAQLLSSGTVLTLALGHPETALEAGAVRQALKALGADADMEPYIVYPKSHREIVQLVREQGAFAILPDSLMRQQRLKMAALFPETAHPPIEYRAVVLAGDNMDEARRFIEFLKLPNSIKTLQEF